MRGLYFNQGVATLRHDLAAPTPPPGEAVIQVLLAGICRTDVEIVKGYAGFQGILGHEFVGQVVAAPDHPQWLGRRVVGEINIACGHCSTCRQNLAMHCPHRQAMGIRGRDGCLADLVCLPVANLHRVPDGVSDQEAVFTEPLAAALAIIDRLHLRPSHRVGVIGDGKLGLLIAQVLALTGCAVTVMGHHPQRIDGLNHPAITFSPADTTATPQWDVTVECSGSPQALATAIGQTRPRGTVVVKSSFQGNPIWPGNALMVNEISLIGSRCGPFAPALRLLARHILTLAPLISATFPLDEAMTALAAAQTRGNLKILLRP